MFPPATVALKVPRFVLRLLLRLLAKLLVSPPGRCVFTDFRLPGIKISEKISLRQNRKSIGIGDILTRPWRVVKACRQVFLGFFRGSVD